MEELIPPSIRRDTGTGSCFSYAAPCSLSTLAFDGVLPSAVQGTFCYVSRGDNPVGDHSEGAVSAHMLAKNVSLIVQV